MTPIALISPLTLVVRDLQGEAVALGEYLFSTGPFCLTAGTLFAMGAGVYREEDMFTQRPVPLEFLDAPAAPDHRAARTVYSPGVLGLFGAAALSPVNPANVAARLAIGNADAGVSLAVGAVVAPGAVAVMAARTGVARYGPA